MMKTQPARTCGSKILSGWSLPIRSQLIENCKARVSVQTIELGRLELGIPGRNRTREVARGALPRSISQTGHRN